MKAGEAAVEAARLQLQYSTIRAPISGRTGSLLVREGNLVRANDAQPLVVINQIRPILVRFSVPRRSSPRSTGTAPGGASWSRPPPGGGGTPQQGTLSFVDNAMDSATGTILLKATFPNDGDASGRASSPVRLPWRSRRRRGDPGAGGADRQQGQYVFVIAPINGENRAVKVARTVGGDAVVASGVSPGETVVTDGQLRLVPGVKVQTREGAPGGGVA